MRLVSKLCTASIVCAMLGLCVSVASASPWRLGKSKLPRLSSQTQNVAIQHIKVTTPWVSVARKRHNR
jgi:hypothetical protein